MANAFFSDLLATISERGRTLLRRDSADTKQDADGLIELCGALLSGRGEASGTAMAREVLDLYGELDATGRRAFFDALVRDFGPDRERLTKAIEKWSAEPTDEDASSLHFASEPRRQELIRRLNRAPGGTGDLVAMRADLLGMMNGHTDLAALDRDVSHLLSSWFNRGFSCCAGLTGRLRPTSSKRSSAMKPCTRSATGTICAGASTRSIAAATRSSIQQWSTSP